MPYTSSVEAGDYGSYSLLFDQSGYVPDISDFTVDGEGVTLSLFESGSGMGLRADVADDVAGGSDFSIYFLDQEIINLTTIEKLAVVSVNGSSDFPLDLEVAIGGSLDFTLGFSHDYTPYYTDFAVDPSSGGSWAPRPEDTWRFQPAVGSAGSTVELYCIDTLIARVTVVEEVIFNPASSAESGDVNAAHNLYMLFGADIASWPMEQMVVGFTDGSISGYHLDAVYDSSNLTWSFGTGSSWGSFGVKVRITDATIEASFNGKIYRISAIIAGGKTYVVN